MSLAIWFQEDIAAAIVAVLVAKGHPDSLDLRALAAVVRVPWCVIEQAYRQQVGEKVEVRR
jgi:hypothetical protein